MKSLFVCLETKLGEVLGFKKLVPEIKVFNFTKCSAQNEFISRCNIELFCNSVKRKKWAILFKNSRTKSGSLHLCTQLLLFLSNIFKLSLLLEVNIVVIRITCNKDFHKNSIRNLKKLFLRAS